jgi:hypothetical protein
MYVERPLRLYSLTKIAVMKFKMAVFIKKNTPCSLNYSLCDKRKGAELLHIDMELVRLKGNHSNIFPLISTKIGT